MNDLDKLAIKYKTDKLGKHHYTPFYYELFKDKREKVKKVLEIGVSEGASLRMWRDFFPNAEIYGGEIEDKYIFKEDRIEVFKCDQGSLEDIISLIIETGNDLDLVIDDACHQPNKQVFTCRALVPLLHGDPLYVIEDVAKAWVLREVSRKLKDYDCEMIRVGDRYDDRLITVKKHGN